MRTIQFCGMDIPVPTLDVQLELPADYTGCQLVYFKDGEVTSHTPLRKGEFITTFDGFIQLAHRSGWVVTPPPFRKNVIREKLNDDR
ncbi:hypothetical protein DOV67_14425 [Salmonella enterica subsp. enterica serovar Java]|uniref:Uncharacterized protein n=3 Tax=Salmonella enterica TaxID=28901 RepID=A0A403JY46_SALER|nr:hypothetical protein [Salmonella enterica subsp. enterica serovar Java]EAO1476411.1 hypothetical protein [Salmonella enterica]EBR8572755.1 hypothetical protein [Salmonella enterica subsp. enterica serovar Java]ECS8428075.1 hypothetical protein [Salmonella enterica]EDR2520081.1 hypothetical protein [Salmonella enterica subsp. enterica serovar Java]